MKLTNLFIILLLFFSCDNKKDIAEFEKTLGKENSKTLTSLVNNFETDFLKNQYPSLNTRNAYRQFLTELKNGKINHWQSVSEESRQHFKQSNLRLEIYSIPDSVWLEKDSDKITLNSNGRSVLMIKNKYLKPDGTYGYNTSESHSRYNEFINEDSIIKIRENQVSINYVGSYTRAINSISKKSHFLTNYLDIRDVAGIINPQIIADKMLVSNVDLDDYFIKRLIITEIVY